MSADVVGGPGGGGSGGWGLLAGAAGGPSSALLWCPFQPIHFPARNADGVPYPLCTGDLAISHELAQPLAGPPSFTSRVTQPYQFILSHAGGFYAVSLECSTYTVADCPLLEYNTVGDQQLMEVSSTTRSDVPSANWPLSSDVSGEV